MFQHDTSLESPAASSISLMTQASARLRAGDWVGAQACLHEVLQSHPDHQEALYRSGVIATRLGQPQQAVAWLERLVALDPSHVSGWVTLGVALRSLQRFDQAEYAYAQAVHHDPACVDAHFNWGNLHWARGRAEQALQAYDQALRGAPQQAVIHSNRALSLHALGRSQEALAACEQAINLAPQAGHGHFHRGNILMDLQQSQQALAAYDQALERDPAHAAAHNNRGNALIELRRAEDALQAYERALQLQPHDRDARVNQARALYELGRFEQAVAANDAVLARYPQDAHAHDQRGVALQGLGQLDDALASHDKALLIEPQRELSRMNRSMCLLRMGRWREAWPDYEARWSSQELRGQADALKNWEARRWAGSITALEGRDILLYAEQGLGDTLQACRYVSWVARYARRVLLQVPPSLEPLVQTLEGVAQCVPAAGPWPRFDWQCPLMSLPGAAGTEPHNVWAPLNYLSADPQRIVLWQNRLGLTPSPRIGLMWRGGDGSRIKGRSLDLQALLAVLPTGPQYISLQRDLPDHDLAVLRAHPTVQHWGAEQTDFADAAALCTLVDLVISVDTSMAHLAGALGRPVWILLPKFCDWRWLQDRDDTPWYPTARLWRQARHGDWQAVLTRVGAALHACVTPPASLLSSDLSRLGRVAD